MTLLVSVGAAPSLLVALTLCAVSRPADRIVSERNVWDGVYTAAQAERGSRVYAKACVACHPYERADHSSRGLSGEGFWRVWSEDNVWSMFSVIKTTMPRGMPSSLSDEAYLDVIAHILNLNDLPAANDELIVSTLEHIQITRKEGPGKVPSYSLVKSSGCLEKASGDSWTLTHASEPVRTRQPDVRADVGSQYLPPLGALTFRLLSVYPSPAEHEGHRMEVRGLLIRDAENNKLNVTSLQMTAPNCAP